MNKNTSTKALVKSWLMTALTVVLMITATYMPLVGYITTFVWPLPIAMLCVKHGKQYGIMALLTAVLLMSIIGGEFITPIMMLLLFGPSSIILGHCIVHKKPAYLTIVVMAVAMFIGVLIMLKAYNLFYGQDLIATTISIFDEAIKHFKEVYASMNMPEEIMTALNSLDASQIVMLMPVVLAGTSLTMSFITYIIAEKLFKRFGHSLEAIKAFSEWYLPKGLVFVVTLIVIASYLGYYANWSMAYAYFNNTYMIFMYMFIINGLAALAYFFRKKGMPKGIRIFICICVALSGLATILIYVGLIDNALNLRKLDKSRVKRV